MNVEAQRPAVFLDRDKTLIEDPGYIDHPDLVRLIDGVPEALIRLRDLGYALVIVTNQSGIARGLLTEDDLAAIHDRLRDLLREKGAEVDAVYFCPYLDGPQAVLEEYRRDSELRKPKPGMLLLAAEEMGLDLERSWIVGDSFTDAEAGRAAGCRAVLVGDFSGEDRSRAEDVAEFVAKGLDQAVEHVREQTVAPGTRAVESEHPEESQPGCQQPKPQSKTALKTPPQKQATPRPSLGSDPRSMSEVKMGSSSRSDGSQNDEVLSQILDELRMMRRERQYEDFSIGKLAGAVTQAFALCAIGWGLYVWIQGGDGSATSTTIWLLAGIAFQLLALTCFSSAHKK